MCNFGDLISGVYFKVVVRSEQVTVLKESVVPWDGILDNVGDGYNETTHKFTAPVTGIYQFTITVMNSDVFLTYLFMAVDGAHVCKALAVHDGRQTGVCSRVVRLNAGQEVWAENKRDFDMSYYGNGYTSFSGVLLQVEV